MGLKEHVHDLRVGLVSTECRVEVGLRLTHNYREKKRRQREGE